MDKLCILSGPLTGVIAELIGEEITIGRAPDNAICMDDESVSDHHAVIVRQNSECVVRDLGSTNGTFVRGDKVIMVTLQNGDRVAFGSVEARFETTEVKLHLPTRPIVPSSTAPIPTQDVVSPQPRDPGGQTIQPISKHGMSKLFQLAVLVIALASGWWIHAKLGNSKPESGPTPTPSVKQETSSPVLTQPAQASTPMTPVQQPQVNTAHTVASLTQNNTPGTPEQIVEVKRRAEGGDAQSQTQLGKSLLFGWLGLARDEVEAAKWLRKAAEQNDPMGQHWLGSCYYRGHGVTKDYEEAVKWLRKASEQDEHDAQAELGDCYRDGLGVTKDVVEAYKWYVLAMAQGGNRRRASEAIPMMERLMTAEQIAKGQELARNFKASLRPVAERAATLGVPPAEPVPAATTGQVGAVSLSTIPAGVEILVNGKSQGVTQASDGQAYSDPLIITNVLSGQRTIECVKPAYSPFSRRIYVAGNHITSLPVELMPQTLPPVGKREYALRASRLNVDFAGTWNVTYSDRTSRTYIVGDDGSVLYVEGNQKGHLQKSTRDGSLFGRPSYSGFNRNCYAFVFEDGRREELTFPNVVSDGDDPISYTSATIRVTHLNGNDGVGHSSMSGRVQLVRSVRAPEPSDPSSASQRLCLLPEWNPPYRGEPAFQDLQCLLGADGNPVVDTRPHPEIFIYKNIRYLEPLSSVCQKFGDRRLTGPVQVTTPGFPAKSLLYYSADGKFEEDFTSLLIVTDSKQQVVAMEFRASYEEANSERWHHASSDRFPSPNTRVMYDLIDGRDTAGSDYLGYTKWRQGGCLALETDLGSSSHGRSPRPVIQRVRLYLPQPIVDLVLFRCKPSITAQAIASIQQPSAQAGLSPTPLTGGLCLSTEWQNMLEKGSIILAELQSLVAAHGTPEVDLQPHPEIMIYKDIHYLEPFGDVCKKFGRTQFSAPVQLGCPGFPEKSFYYYAFDGDFDAGFTRMLVVADVKKQVVAIEFTEDAVKGTSSGFGGPGNEWKVFDFVRLRMKGITSWSVDRSIRETAEHSKNPKCWRIDCRLMGGGKERQRTRLFLPQPIVNLVLFRLSGQKYQPPQQ